jgi:hypothetical protein
LQLEPGVERCWHCGGFVHPPVEQASESWHRCENCNKAYVGPMLRFGTPKLCPNCVPRPAARSR